MRPYYAFSVSIGVPLQPVSSVSLPSCYADYTDVCQYLLPPVPPVSSYLFWDSCPSEVWTELCPLLGPQSLRDFLALPTGLTSIEGGQMLGQTYEWIQKEKHHEMRIGRGITRLLTDLWKLAWAKTCSPSRTEWIWLYLVSASSW